MAWTAEKTWSVGELAKAADLNTYLRDDVGFLKELTVRKSATETVTSSTALQNDDELLFAIAASETWQGRFVLFATGAAGAGGLDIAVTVPTSAVVVYGASALPSGIAGPYHATASGTRLSLAASQASIFATIEVTCANSTNAGNVQLQWAQNNSSGTATSVLVGSSVVAHRIA